METYPKNYQCNTGKLTFLACVAALGGFLFGFDTAVISGTIDSLRAQFGLTPLLEGWVVSSALVGCILGAACAGSLSDRFGRKKLLFCSAVLFLISAIGSAVPQTVSFLVAARLIGGLGVGIASMLSPLYISEFSPAALRGRMVALYQLAIVVGILGAYLSNSIIIWQSAGALSRGNGGLYWILGAENWRGMFLMETIPAAVFLLLMLFVPESPRWLAKQGQFEQAIAGFSKVLSPDEARREINQLIALLDCEQGHFSELFRPGLRKALVIGLLLPFFSQVTGINVIIYYGTSIFKDAGMGIGSAFSVQVVIGCINVVFTLIAIWKVDRFGRKPLLQIGAVGLSVILLLLGIVFRPGAGATWLISILFFLHVGIFSMSWGPVTWIVLSEIFPTKIRGRAMSFSTFILWVSCGLVAQTFPLLRDYLGSIKTFCIYGLFLLPSALFIAVSVPETKQRTLEDIELFWGMCRKKRSAEQAFITPDVIAEAD